MMLKRQFLQEDTGVFDQALGDQEVAAVVSGLATPHRERVYPHWTRYAYLWVRYYLRLCHRQAV